MKEKKSLMIRISSMVVDRRNLLFFCYILAVIFSLFSMNWVSIENDLTAYLSDDTETRQGLTIMEDEFVTLGTAQIMLSNISYDKADNLAEQIRSVAGVASLEFNNDAESYKDSAALFSVSFSCEPTDDVAINAMEEITAIVVDYDMSISTAIGSSYAADLAAEMNIIILIASIIIVAVLILTSKSYAEIPVFLITFCTAALLNMGSNYLLGTISFVSNSVAVVLQLALAIDYAIILNHRFIEEREHFEAREACIIALSKAIPEVFASSLTTISGLAALAFMHFKIGGDLSMVLIKSILISLLCVFTLMPGLLMLFSNKIDKTQHKSFIPSLEVIGRISIKARFVILPIFVVVLSISFLFANKCPYLFGNTDLRAIQKNETQIANDRIKEKFGRENMIALLVPGGAYEQEALLLEAIEGYDEVSSTTGLSNTEAVDGYVLTDMLTARQFSELIDLDYEVAQLLYSAYAVNDEDYAKVLNGIGEYSVPLLDMFQFVYQQVDEGYVTLEDDMRDDLEVMNQQLSDAKKQLKGENYSRMLIFLDLPEESKETFQFLDTIHDEASKYYEKDVFIVGNSTSNADLSETFNNDNILISILSAFFVIFILLFTFQSLALPILLIIVIQAAIWINFSFPYLQNNGLFFMGYLVVSSIQMGANIDYAIVITSRYLVLKETMPFGDAIIKAVDQAFPTIITSGSILASAGILIQFVTTDGIIASIGECLGRGTIISISLVLFVLPAMLYFGDSIVEKTSFSIKIPDRTVNEQGKMQLNGKVKGYISGQIDADINGTITGEISAIVEGGALTKSDDSKEKGILEYEKI